MSDTFAYNYPVRGRQAYALNAQALALLGAALILQAMLAIWCMMPSKPRRILSWNSGLLNTTLALLHKNRIRRTQGYPTAPRSRQTPASKAARPFVVIVILLRILFRLILIWGLIMWFVELKMNHGKANTSFDPENTSGGVYPNSHQTPSRSLLFILPLAIITAMQIIYTLALHAAEQVVNLTRDEVMWHRAGDLSEGSAGASLSPMSLKIMLTAWQSLALLVLKPVSHWIFDLSVVGFSFGYIAFNPVPIFCLAVLSLVLAVMVTFLAFRKPEGPQPVAWGNIQKLANFVDDWGDGTEGRLYWGDKGVEDSGMVRLAGTAPLRQGVTEIRMDGVLYKGLG